MFKRNSLLILEDPEYGLGPVNLPPMGDVARYTDTPYTQFPPRKLVTIRKDSDKTKKLHKERMLPIEMPFNSPRWRESK